MREQIRLILSALIVLILVPVTVTLILSGYHSVSLGKKPGIEMYLGEIVYREIPENYSKEAIKAQVVLARSTLQKGLKEGSISSAYLEQVALELKKDMEKKSFLEKYDLIQECISETKGEVLTYHDKLCEGSFHRVSAGSTRDGQEVLEDSTYEYITSVESAMDMESEDYMSWYYFTPEELYQSLKKAYPSLDIKKEDIPGKIKITSRDGEDYVLEVEIGNVTCSGEELRTVLSLGSSNFTISKMGDEIRFLCRGMGHGLGMSQFGANKMASDGASYKEILAHYFPKVEIIVYESE